MGCLALVLLGPISCSGSCLARPYLMSFESELGRDPLSHIVRKLISRRARVKGKPLLSYEEERSVPLGKIVYSVPSPFCRHAPTVFSCFSSSSDSALASVALSADLYFETSLGLDTKLLLFAKALGTCDK
jgi:hypothetical protein